MSHHEQPSNFRTAFLINLKLLYATFIFVLGYLLWPNDIKWYGFYLVSIAFYLTSIALVINAIKQMIERYKRDKAITDTLAQGQSPKTSKVLHDDQALKDAGLYGDE